MINYLNNPINTVESIASNFYTLMRNVFDIEVIDEYRYEILNEIQN